MEERRIQRRENHKCTPLLLKHGKSQCTHLRVNGALVSDPSQLLEVWTQHFQNLAKSQVETNPYTGGSNETVNIFALQILSEGGSFLDVPFTIEEVGHAVKPKKSAGPDDLTAEHLKYGGQSIIKWLTGILNSVINVELCLKQGITIPIYKGGGNDPLDVNGYRGSYHSQFSHLKGA